MPYHLCTQACCSTTINTTMVTLPWEDSTASRSGLAVRRLAEGPRLDSTSALPSLQKGCGLWTLSLTISETSKWLSSLPVLMQGSSWWWQCSDRYWLKSPSSPTSICPSLISLMVSVGVKYHEGRRRGQAHGNTNNGHHSALDVLITVEASCLVPNKQLPIKIIINLFPQQKIGLFGSPVLLLLESTRRKNSIYNFVYLCQCAHYPLAFMLN